MSPCYHAKTRSGHTQPLIPCTGNEVRGLERESDISSPLGVERGVTQCIPHNHSCYCVYLSVGQFHLYILKFNSHEVDHKKLHFKNLTNEQRSLVNQLKCVVSSRHHYSISNYHRHIRCATAMIMPYLTWHLPGLGVKAVSTCVIFVDKNLFLDIKWREASETITRHEMIC
jgi:hypothetical protein